MTKVRDINDEPEPNQTCCEKVASWQLWKKILLGVGIASALTLVITLPIVLTVNETSVIPDGNMTTASGSTGLFTTTIAADGTTTSASKTTFDKFGVAIMNVFSGLDQNGSNFIKALTPYTCDLLQQG